MGQIETKLKRIDLNLIIWIITNNPIKMQCLYVSIKKKHSSPRSLEETILNIKTHIGLKLKYVKYVPQ